MTTQHKGEEKAKGFHVGLGLPDAMNVAKHSEAFNNAVVSGPDCRITK
jgi:hypothetical protein